MKLTELIRENSGDIRLEYEQESIGAHSGQSDFELGVYRSDKTGPGDGILGMVAYTLYDGEITVRDVIVRPEFRRKGLGSKLMQKMKELHLGEEYRPSLKTDLGSKFKHKEYSPEEMKKL